MKYDKRIIFLDIETQKAFNEIDRSKLHQLKISVVGIYDSHDDAYLCFEEKELVRLEERLKAADLIVGFNIVGFDMKVLAPCLLCDTRTFKVLDMLEEIHKACGHRVSLQSLAQGTFQDSKSGSGFNAIQLFRDGRIDDLKKYCLDDVRITKRLYDYGVEHKKVHFYSNRDFSVHEIPVNWGEFSPQPEVPADGLFPTSLF